VTTLPYFYLARPTNSLVTELEGSRRQDPNNQELSHLLNLSDSLVAELEALVSLIDKVPNK